MPRCTLAIRWWRAEPAGWRWLRSPADGRCNPSPSRSCECHRWARHFCYGSRPQWHWRMRWWLPHSQRALQTSGEGRSDGVGMTNLQPFAWKKCNCLRSVRRMYETRLHASATYPQFHFPGWTGGWYTCIQKPRGGRPCWLCCVFPQHERTWDTNGTVRATAVITPKPQSHMITREKPTLKCALCKWPFILFYHFINSCMIMNIY